MPRIFGRDTTRPHGALARLLTAMLRSSEESYQAIAWNLLHDDRVSEDRADHFFHFTNAPSTPEELLFALRHYVEEFINVRPPEESYLAPENSSNLLRISPKPAFELGHIVNVTWILRTVRNGVFDPARLGLDLAAFDDAEALILRARRPDNLALLVDRLLHAYFVLRHSRPIWAAKWRDLRKNISADEPQSWNQTVGVWRKFDTVQLLVRYSARKAVRLARPTQLDIGAFEYHFPSPCAAGVELGGFCMLLRDLGSQYKRRGLVSEFIHPPVQFTSTDWLRTGGWLRSVSGADAGTVVGHRQQHLERLQEKLPDTRHWRLR